MNDLTIGQVAGAGSPVAYNPVGQIVSLPRDNDAYAWTAHALFERDYAVNGLNQYTSAGGTSFGYDGRGNLTSSGTAAYGYTRLNELKSAPNLAAGSGTVTLTYDTQGRLSQYNTGSAIKLLYAGPNLVAEIGATGSILRRYVHGTGSDEAVVWYEGADTSSRRFLHADQLGSIAAVSDAGGVMLAINRYDEYGIPQAGNLGRFQYTGQTWFGELGLYNYKARWYSASLGRFLQTDPIGYKDQLNLYAYVGNDPVNKRDPTGLYTCKGETAECNSFKAYLSSVRNSVGRDQTGRISDPTVRAAIKYYGSDNGKGPTITFRPEDGRALASQVNGNVNLDIAKINGEAASYASRHGMNAAEARGLVGGGVLVHEGVHGTNGGATEILTLQTAPRIAKSQYWEEVRAYEAEWNYYFQFGYAPKFSRSQVSELAEGSCRESSLSVGNAQMSGQYGLGCSP